MTTLTFILGAAAIVAGCALISAALAFIVGGAIASTTAVFYERGAE